MTKAGSLSSSPAGSSVASAPRPNWTVGDPATMQTMAAVRKHAKSFRLKESDPCLCGSGLNFATCCRHHLPGPDKIGVASRDRIRGGHIDAALIFARSDVTQYTLWHKSHTEAAAIAGVPGIEPLLSLDVKVLQEYLEVLIYCHRMLKRWSELPALLERLRANIRNDRWQRRILYFQVLAAAGPDWNENAARTEFAKLGELDQETDVQILQLYLHLFSDKLSFSQKIALIDRIEILDGSIANRLHYAGARASLYFGVGDINRAGQILDHSVAGACAEKPIDQWSSYEKYRLAMNSAVLGSMKNDSALIERAITLYQGLLDSGEMSPAGRADVYRLMGDAFRYAKKWEQSTQSYTMAYQEQPLPIFKVLLAESHMGLKEYSQAHEVLDQVKADDFHGSELEDYVFAVANAAIAVPEDEQRLDSAKSALKQLVPEVPHFRERRDALLLELYEVGSLGQGKPISVADRIRSILPYVGFKPSFLGMSIDIGKMVEDANKRRSKNTKGAKS